MSDKKETSAEQPMGYFVPMQQQPADDEIELLELWNAIWSERKKIFLATAIAAVLSITISLLLPNYYKAEVLLAPVAIEDKSKGLASALGGLGGLATLAGVNIGSGTNVEESLSVLKSKEFLWAFIKDNKLMPILFGSEWDEENNKWKETEIKKQPTLWDAYRLLIEDGVLITTTNKDTGLVSIGVEWKNAELATIWANKLVARLNNYLRNKAIMHSKANLEYLNKELVKNQVTDFQVTLYKLIAEEQQKAMIANTQKDFAFRVLDKAVIPDIKSKPNHVNIVLAATLFVLLSYTFFILIKFLFSTKSRRD